MKYSTVSMVDRVLNLNKDMKDWSTPSDTLVAYRQKTRSYANFLNMEHHIGMFLPAVKVNGEWVVLEEPEDYYLYSKPKDIDHKDSIKEWHKQCKQYQTALGNVIFANVTFDNFNQGEDARFYTVDGIQIFNTDINNERVYWHTERIEELVREGNLELTKYGAGLAGFL